METKVVELELTDVLPNRFQPRIKFSEESIQNLANSIRDHGVIQPIVVRKIGDKFEIIAGERRYKASALAEKRTIPAIITDLNEKDSAEVALIENVQRKDLTPIEEAVSYKKILDMGYLTQDVLASKLGKTQSTIANKLRLLNLDDDVQEALLNEQISERHARSLLRLTSKSKQKEMLNRIINERLTVRKADEEIDKMMNNNENIEVFNFGAVPVSNKVEPIETLDMFNPEIETLNIPTAPIQDDTIPEILPFPSVSTEIKSEPEVFVPKPEIINSSVSPVPEEKSDFGFNEPIQEPKPSAVETLPVNEIETLQDNSSFINPGFMDINRIETNAQEINEEKPLAPVETLLKPSTLEPLIEQNQVEPEEDVEQDILVPGKFFNLMPEEESEEIISTEPIADNFNFNLDINSLNNVESTKEIETPNVSQNLFYEPVAPNTEVKPEPIFNPLNNENQIHENPIPPVSNFDSPTDTIAELELPQVNGFMNMPDLDNITANETIKEPVLTQSTVDLKTAINTIRDLADQLSRMGYVIDTDEFDFEDMYQVIFKINK